MYQNTVVVGHLGRDPEMRYTPTGTPVCNFTIATTRKWTGSDGEQHEKTTWFRVTTWNKLAELCNQYLSRGRLVLVEGDIDASAFMGEGYDKPKATLELTANEVKFLTKNGSNSGNGSPGGLEEDEIPF